MVKVELNKTYVARNGSKFFVRKAVADGLMFDKGYRFEAKSVVGDMDSPTQISTTILVNELGKHNLDMHSTPYDLVRLYIDEVIPGDVLGDIHGHELTSGDFKGWEVYSPFEITSDMFYGMLEKLPTNGELIQNKMARAVSTIIGITDEVNGILVIYLYDHAHYCAMVYRPGMFKK